MGWHMHQMGIGAWIYLIVLILFFVIAGIYLTQQKKDPPEDAEDDPVNILKKRYARGDITSQEYGEMKKNLSEE